ncbi:MAG: TSCPD domain-containing protein [Nitrososphaerales archaeon]
MSKLVRPKSLSGVTVKVSTGCGNSYITCNSSDEGPFEVFCRLGKAGGCANCQMEALTRAITVGLRYGVPVDEYVRQLSNLGCPSPSIDSQYDDVRSCPDAIAKVMADLWGKR